MPAPETTGQPENGDWLRWQRLGIEPPSDETMEYEVCSVCGAADYGNATCPACVRRWPERGISQEVVDRILSTLDGCPVCGGDCASANPPVVCCPMRKDP